MANSISLLGSYNMPTLKKIVHYKISFQFLVTGHPVKEEREKRRHC